MPERAAAADGSPLHYDEAGSLQMLDETLRHDRRHEFVRVVDALATLEAQGEGERVGDVFRRGGRERSGTSGIGAGQPVDSNKERTDCLLGRGMISGMDGRNR